MNPLETYTDYRQYLRDYYLDAKARFSWFSYRFFCQRAGIGSPSFYKEVVGGKRNLTEKTIVAFTKGLGLKGQKAELFRALVHFTQAKTSLKKQKYLEEMHGLLSTVKEKRVPTEYFAYYSKWYNIAIRELACLLDWQDNYKLLASSLQPEIGVRQAKKAMQLLLDLGLLQKRPDGRYEQTDPHITSGAEVTSLSVRRANRQLSELAIEAIETVLPNKRDISSLTMGISKKTYGLVKQEIVAFRNRLKQLVANQEKPERVYNMNLQFFPLSKMVVPAKEGTDG